MKLLQIIALIGISIFYVAYFTKMLLQKRKGIQTSQLTKGKVELGVKDKRTMAVEKLLMISSFLVLPVELISIVLDTSWTTNHMVRIFGLVLVGLGNLAFIAAMVTMKDSWRAGIPESDHTELVSNGIYQMSRNPAFLGFDLTYIGFLLAFSNIWLLLVTVMVIVSMHLQILEEERFLERKFGDSYIQYRKKVGRYFLIL